MNDVGVVCECGCEGVNDVGVLCSESVSVRVYVCECKRETVVYLACN